MSKLGAPVKARRANALSIAAKAPLRSTAALARWARGAIPHSPDYLQLSRQR